MSSQSQSQMQAQSQSQSQSTTTTSDPFPSTRDNPPDYDTLSLAPPSINHHPTQPSSSSPPTSTSKSSTLRQKFAALKAEDERRKAERITYVSAAEADRITGLDRHRVEEERKSSERRRGGKNVLAFLMLS